MTYLPTSDQEPRVRITRVSLTNFKGFSKYSVSLEPMTILVGPNNAGKSTIIETFRALSVALRTARRRRPEILPYDSGSRRGYRVPSEGIPISLENAQFNYVDQDAVAEFRLSNGRSLSLVFSGDQDCHLVIDTDGPIIRSIADFNRHFPIDVGVVPVLGPVEHQEQLVEPRTVERNLQTHRASRNFRNYWYQGTEEEFEEFRREVVNVWDGIDIQKPELSYTEDGLPVVHMMCTENRMSRELYWLGFGFQIWLQILTHVLRARAATTIVVDEPETYLHPELQSRLLRLLRQGDADCVLATHSSELVGEAERSEIVLVDKGKRSGKRLGAAAHTDALDVLGSRYNFALTDVLRQRAAILVEGGSDGKHFKQLGRRLSQRLLSGAWVAPFLPLGGHHPEDAMHVAKAMKRLVGHDARLAVVLDRDYRSDEEVEAIEASLKEDFEVAHVLRKKEIENYFLTPDVIARALRARGDKGRYSSREGVSTLLNSITEEMERKAQSQCLAQHVAHGRRTRPEVDQATFNEEALERFHTRWESLDSRLELVSGKDVRRALNSALQKKGAKALTLAQLAGHITAADIPSEMARLLRELDGLTGP